MEIAYKPDRIPITKWIWRVPIFFLWGIAIPVFGWLGIMGWLAELGSDRLLSKPYGFLFPRCPKCGHLFGDNESKFDDEGIWSWFKCRECSHTCKYRNLALLGGSVIGESSISNPWGQY